MKTPTDKPPSPEHSKYITESQSINEDEWVIEYKEWQATTNGLTTPVTTVDMDGIIYYILSQSNHISNYLWYLGHTLGQLELEFAWKEVNDIIGPGDK